MGLSFWHILILALVVVLLFGRGKISDLMGDVAKGIKSFKKGLADDETPPAETPRTIDQKATPASMDKTEDRSKAG
ncbi:twin-arginine translocase TatA/TatE family subunit [Segnochrobactraceae bacterium EtOH-i3]